MTQLHSAAHSLADRLSHSPIHVQMAPQLAEMDNRGLKRLRNSTRGSEPSVLVPQWQG